MSELRIGCGCDPESGHVCINHRPATVHLSEFSAQPCGCDPGALWICENHRAAQSTLAKFPPTPFEIVATKDVERKKYPVTTGVLDYFPLAILEVAHVSYVGGEQHHPGEALHWDRAKSTDEADALMRHFLQRGKLDTDGLRHSAKVAWRALALLQKEIELEDLRSR
jgi:dATP/dGTP diphosphohydrolase